MQGGEEWDLITIPIFQNRRQYFLAAVIDRDSQVILQVQLRSVSHVDPGFLRRAADITRESPTTIRISAETGYTISMSPKCRVERRPTEEITEDSRLGEFAKIIKRRTEDTRGRRSRRDIQQYAEGLAMDLNHFRAAGPGNPCSPAEKAGFQPPCISWEHAASTLLYGAKYPADATQQAPEPAPRAVQSAEKDVQPCSKPPRGHHQHRSPEDDEDLRNNRIAELLQQLQEFCDERRQFIDLRSAEVRSITRKIEAAGSEHDAAARMVKTMEERWKLHP